MLTNNLLYLFPLFILISRNVSFVDLYSFFYKSVYNRGIFVTLTCTRFLSSVFSLLHPSNIGDYIFFPVFLPPCFLSSHFLSSPIFLSSKHTLTFLFINKFINPHKFLIKKKSTLKGICLLTTYIQGSSPSQCKCSL